MPNINENEIAFNFTLHSCARGDVSLDKLDSNYIILYFYPKDDTPGCTMEAQDFSKLKSEFDSLKAEVIGISKNDSVSHKKFMNKYDLKVDLLSDSEEVAEKYGVWVEKNMYGKKYMGIERTTFLLDKDRKVLKVWEKVKVDNHAKEVLDYIKSL